MNGIGEGVKSLTLECASISEIPDFIVIAVLRYLNYADRLHCELVSRRFHRLATSQLVWRREVASVTYDARTFLVGSTCSCHDDLSKRADASFVVCIRLGEALRVLKLAAAMHARNWARALSAVARECPHLEEMFFHTEHNSEPRSLPSNVNFSRFRALRVIRAPSESPLRLSRVSFLSLPESIEVVEGIASADNWHVSVNATKTKSDGSAMTVLEFEEFFRRHRSLTEIELWGFRPLPTVGGPVRARVYAMIAEFCPNLKCVAFRGCAISTDGVQLLSGLKKFVLLDN